MNPLQYLKPCHEQHSVKEAVITLFLDNKIVEPQNFKPLLNNPLDFERFEIVKSQELKFDASQGFGTLNNNQEVGFEFINSQEGKILQVLRGINQPQETQISYHTLDYTRWTPFKEAFFRDVSHLTNIQASLLVKSFGIYYIDDFFWEDSTNPIPIHLIFKPEQDIIPKHFFGSKNSFFSLITEQTSNELPFIERFDIRIEPKAIYPNVPSVRIMHNVLQNFTEAIELKYFLSQLAYISLIEKAHIYNKDMIKQILTQEVQNIIHLT